MDRATLKRLMPSFLKSGLERLREHLDGPGIEYAVVRDNIFVADESPVPRINLIIPGLSSAMAFGGVTTGLNFFDGLVRQLAPLGVDARIVTERPVFAGDNVALSYAALAQCEFHSLSRSQWRLPTRACDLFVVFNWWVSHNLEAVLDRQARHFRQPPRPKLHLIQEYEPLLHPFSAAHLLSRQAMGARWPLWAVFNTRELRDFWHAQGHAAEQSYVFEPRMNAKLRPFADNLSADEKSRTILVYGRPEILRNAFFLVHRALDEWSRTYGASHRDWRLVSAGLPHKDIRLANGHRLASLGKLGFDDYGRLLRETPVGLSLMASPHPSYPPLEMAHFGARVLTNNYPFKRPGARHDNLVELESLHPGDIASAIEKEIAAFAMDPLIGIRGRSHMASYLEEDRIECLDAVAAAIGQEMNLEAPAVQEKPGHRPLSGRESRPQLEALLPSTSN